MACTLPRCIPCRYVYMILGFFGMLFCFALKTNLAMAMVSMVNHTAIRLEQDREHNLNTSKRHVHLDTVPEDELPVEHKEKDGTFMWSLSLQGIIVSSYFWGYLFGQIPGARIAEDVSGAWAFFAGVSAHILGTLLIPVAATVHYGLIICIRVVQGFLGGFTFPATHFLLTRWAPPNERSLIGSFVYSGAPMGNVLSLLCTANIAYYINWEASFYIMGAIGLPWMLLWVIFINDNPRKHKFIREDEKDYLTQTLQLPLDDTSERLKVPWKTIASSGQVWVLVVTHISLCWGVYTSLTQLPLFMKMVLEFRLDENGFVSSVPFIGMFIFSLAYGRLTDYVISTDKIPLTIIRRFSTIIATAIPAMCYVAVSFTTDKVIAVALIVTANTFLAAMYSGFQQAHMDIASHFAATLISLTNTCGTLTGIAVPIFAGWLLDRDPSVYSWRIIFFVTAGFYLLGTFAFGLFAKSEELPWNIDNRRRRDTMLLPRTSYHLPRFIPCRYIYMLLGFLGMLFTFAMMTNLAIAMVSMVNHTAIKILHEDDFRSIRGIVHFHLDTIPDDEILPEESPEDGTNIWSLSLQGIIISSYFWGYLLGQLPGARLSEDVSGAWTFFAGVSIHILGTLLIPEAGHIHYGLIIAIRVVQGFMGGFTFPATHFLLTRWAPPHERSLISSFVYSGGPMGNVISLIFTGSICYYINWEASFYILGGISAPWMILWAILVNDNPRKHKFIREEEREYLTTTLQLTDDKMSHSRVPWKSIARSGQVWILILTHSALCWGFYVNLTQLPLYMKMVLHFRLDENGLVSALPFVGMFIFSLCYGRLADYLISTGKLPLTTVRRLSTVIAATVPALCCIAVPFTTSHVIAVCLMITGNTFFAAVFSGFQQAHMDIASRFAATLMSLTNSCGTVSGIIVPIFSGWMLDKDISMRSWQVIFFVTAGFYLSAAIIFGLFAKSDELPWNKDSYKEDE